MNYKLEDIFDIRRFQGLTDSFHRATGIATALLDLDGKILIGSGWQDLCVEFHRKHPQSRAICQQSDTHFNQTLSGEEPYVIYECGHGLIDAAAPVIVEGEHLGNFFTGQFLIKEKDKELRNRFRRQAREYGFDEAAYLRALEEVPVVSEEKIREILAFLVDLSGFIADTCLATLRNRELAAQLEEQVAARTAQLQRSNKELERFAYIASHDLQEPLRKIINFTELLAHRYKGALDEKADRFIDYTVDAARRMSNLINDLLTFSRAGRIDFESQEFDTASALGTVLTDLELKIESAGARVEIGEMPEINFNPTVFMRIMQNLIGNALKFSTEGPLLIRVSAEERAEEWRFCVEDNGIGIEEKNRNKIFEIFQRLHGREIPGTGIGLPLCRRLVERFGGRIWVESEPGTGSRFSFTVPKSIEGVLKHEHATD